MAINVMNWAMHQCRCDGPSAQIVLYVIADTANERGISVHADPQYLVERTRQSRATVFRRLDELEREGAITRYIRRRRNGSQMYEIHCHLNRRIDYGGPDDDCGGESHGETGQIETQVSPVRLPKSHSCDSKSPSKSPDDDDSLRANVSREAEGIADEVMEIAGRRWTDAADVIQAFLDGGYTRDHLTAGARECMARKTGGPPNSINYFKKSWAAAKGRAEQTIDVPKPEQPKGRRHDRRNETVDALNCLRKFARGDNQEEPAGPEPDEDAQGGGTGGSSIGRVPPPEFT